MNTLDLIACCRMSDRYKRTKGLVATAAEYLMPELKVRTVGKWIGLSSDPAVEGTKSIKRGKIGHRGRRPSPCKTE